MEWRPVVRRPEAPGDAAVWSRPRIPVVDGEEPTGLQRAVLSADSGNGISAALDWGTWSFVNIDLDVHLARPLVGDWVLLDAATRYEEPAPGSRRPPLWDVRGRVGRGAQTLVVTPGRRDAADAGRDRRAGARNYARGMPQLRLALAQVDSDPRRPRRQRRSSSARGRRGPREAGAHLVAFPEMVLTGYPVEDLALRTLLRRRRRAALRSSRADLAADGLGDLPVVVGYLDRRATPTSATSSERPEVCVPKGEPQNAAARPARRRGSSPATPSTTCPTTASSTSSGSSRPGSDLTVVRVHGVDVAIAICEDIWQDGGPVALTRRAGAELLLVINGSPYERDKDDVRRELVTRRAAEAGCTLAYVNMVGGQDDLVFDGDSIVVDADGAVLARARSSTRTCSSSTSTCRLDAAHDAPACRRRSPPRRGRQEPVAAVRARAGDDRRTARTTCAEVYARARAGPARLRPQERLPRRRARPVRRHRLGPGRGRSPATRSARHNVVGVSMPSSYSSEHSRDDAADLAKRTGLDYRVVPIAPMVDAFLDALGLTGVAEENLQARVRGVILMGLSNQEGHLVLTTGNKSELAVGYSTIYGDSVGGFNPVKDVPEDAGLGAGPLAQRRGRAPRRDAADPGELDHQGALGRAAPRPDRPGHAARLRRARPAARDATSSRRTAVRSCSPTASRREVSTAS